MPASSSAFFEARRDRREPLVLVYSDRNQGFDVQQEGRPDAGRQARRLPAACYRGGCLETDLAARARVVLESGTPQSVTYELAAGDDDVWGLGIGCDGSMTIGLQALSSGNDYAPFKPPPPTRVLVMGAGPDCRAIDAHGA